MNISAFFFKKKTTITKINYIKTAKNFQNRAKFFFKIKKISLEKSKTVLIDLIRQVIRDFFKNVQI